MMKYIGILRNYEEQAIDTDISLDDLKTFEYNIKDDKAW